MPKKKIAFFLSDFIIGGLEKSFLDFLDIIDRDRYEITVFLPNEDGAWVGRLREKCEVRIFEIMAFKTVLMTELKALHFLGVLKRLFFRILSRYHYGRNYRKSREYLVRSMPVMKEKYDCAVAYQILNLDCVIGCLCCTDAVVKVGWVHGNYGLDEREKIGKRWYHKFDKVFCVSKSAQDYFVARYNALSHKSEVLHNVINPDRIQNLSELKIQDISEDSGIKLVTVGRLSKEKGQNMVPQIAYLLRNDGYDIKWYLIGDGSLREIIENEIKTYKVEDSVFLLGSKDNPYPYIQQCDIYVQTSYTEGWGLTVSEAKILCKPIVTTDAGVMSEQIQSGVNGIIVPDATPEALAAGIEQLILFPQLRNDFETRLAYEKTSASEEIQKFYALMS